MRHATLATVLLAAFAIHASARAADGPWTPAPVPTVGDPTVLPTARAGSGFSASTPDTPFSSVPQGSIAADGATSSNTVDGVKTPNVSGN